MDVTLRIKNLSIALEALSHTSQAQPLYDGVRSLLEEAMEQQYKENHPPQTVRPTTLDEDIPF